jgi:hypothetical protein
MPNSPGLFFDGGVPGRHLPDYVDEGAFSALNGRALAKSPFAAKGTVLLIVPDPHSVNRAMPGCEFELQPLGYDLETRKIKR